MTHQQWYVHILGPDDIEGPFDTMEHALRHAAQINSWLTTREDPITEFTPMLWAVPTQSEWGTTNYEPAVPSVQPPTREQIAAIERVRGRLGSAPDWATDVCVARADLDAVLALFPQPTPSAEPEVWHRADVDHVLVSTRPLDERDDDGGLPDLVPSAQPVRYNGHNGLAVFADAARRLSEPVSIADMAPGTTFTAVPLRSDDGFAPRRWMVTRAGWSAASDHDDHLQLVDIDLSTIRDVTPPPATPEEGDRG